jgi:predicted dehydrogenase
MMNEHVERVVCCDLDERQLQKAKRNFHSIEITKDFRSIIKDSTIDVVVIATPVSTHYPLAKEALQNGKHLLVEKPLTASAAEAEELLNIAEQKNLTLMVDHTFLYTSAVRKIKELVDSGVTGDILYFDSIRINLGLFQHDANVIWDLAPHDFAIMNYILGKKPVSLKAMGADHVGNGMENIAYVHVNFGDNLIAHFHLNWLSPVKMRKLLIGGTKKMIVFDDMENSEKIKVFDKGIDIKTKEDEYQKLVNYRLGDVYSPAINNIEALKGVVDDFINAIQNKTKPLSDGRAGLLTVQLLEASQESIKNDGKLVYL